MNCATTCSPAHTTALVAESRNERIPAIAVKYYKLWSLLRIHHFFKQLSCLDQSSLIVSCVLVEDKHHNETDSTVARLVTCTSCCYCNISS